MTTPPLIILSSTSSARKSVLERLLLPFQTFAPEIDETPLPNEKPEDLVLRLAELKAHAAQITYPNALVIGSDQVAIVNDTILGKPGTYERAVKQLQRVSGQTVNFLTGLCLLNTKTQQIQIDSIPFGIQFRTLTLSQIEQYLHQEKPYNCAGSFRSEGLGIVLIEKIIAEDPTAIMGLPLIRLIQMFEKQGVNVI
jgi:septum formation protein